MESLSVPPVTFISISQRTNSAVNIIIYQAQTKIYTW